MMTFEVNILCAGNKEGKCPKTALVTGEPIDRIEKAIESAEDEARANDWLWVDGLWHCPDCTMEITMPEAHE